MTIILQELEYTYLQNDYFFENGKNMSFFNNTHISFQKYD